MIMAIDTPQTPAEQQKAFEEGVWYRMALWPALRTAIANSWGGPGAEDKRDWFAGAIAELFEIDPAADEVPSMNDLQLDVEDRLLQVMQDEFEVNVEDESEVDVAEDIVKMRRQVFEQGRIEMVDAFKSRYAATSRTGMPAPKIVEVDHDVDDDDDSISHGGADVDMSEAPQLLTARREKPQPMIDDDGFETVMRKR